MAKRVVLAYSGGLDTSVAVHWLDEEHGYEVIAVAVDVGQGSDFDQLARDGARRGAVEAVVVDAVRSWPRTSSCPALQANALYEGQATRSSPRFSRPVIVRHLVAAARQLDGASAVAHGCTGKGNDQVRFEVGTRALAPDLEIVAPVRSWGMTREETIDYADSERHPGRRRRKEKIYSIDENLWGRAIECGVIEDPWAAPPEDVYALTRRRRRSPDRGR